MRNIPACFAYTIPFDFDILMYASVDLQFFILKLEIEVIIYTQYPCQGFR